MIDTLVGAQFGSEGKGLIAGYLAQDYVMHVRAGAANAGHTVYVDGNKYVVQQIPCAAYASPSAILAIAPGGLLSLDILKQEIRDNIQWREQNGLRPLSLLIDPRAHVIQDHHIEEEQQTNLAAAIGSTSTVAKEGIGTATAARVMRDTDKARQVQEEDVAEFEGYVQLIDLTTTIMMSEYHLSDSEHVLLEGTQGTGLSVTTGFWPYTTSRDTTAAGLAADCGIGPRYIRNSIVVARSFPIRVSGNSGPFFPDSRETSFAELGFLPEYTTVTQLERRVATFSYEQIERAIVHNSANVLALTFADYLDNDLYGETDPEVVKNNRTFSEFSNKLEFETGLAVKYAGTGPQTVVQID